MTAVVVLHHGRTRDILTSYNIISVWLTYSLNTNMVLHLTNVSAPSMITMLLFNVFFVFFSFHVTTAAVKVHSMLGLVQKKPH